MAHEKKNDLLHRLHHEAFSLRYVWIMIDVVAQRRINMQMQM
jgi:hypothetical protein